jgi:molecular chaperone GrpE
MPNHQPRDPERPQLPGPAGADPVIDTRASSATGDEGGDSTAELAASGDEAQAMFARYQRLYADFENYKRRSRQDLAERTQYANEELLRRLLPLLDNFKRALDHAPPDIDPVWFDGIKLIARQFEAILQAQGLSTIPAVGEKFDPTRHEAIGQEESDEHEEGTVIEEVQPGYRLHDRVLRPTLVKVAQPRALPR